MSLANTISKLTGAPAGGAHHTAAKPTQPPAPAPQSIHTPAIEAKPTHVTVDPPANPKPAGEAKPEAAPPAPEKEAKADASGDGEKQDGGKDQGAKKSFSRMSEKALEAKVAALKAELAAANAQKRRKVEQERREAEKKLREARAAWGALVTEALANAGLFDDEKLAGVDIAIVTGIGLELADKLKAGVGSPAVASLKSRGEAELERQAKARDKK